SLQVVEVLANSLDPERVEAHLVFTYGGPGPVANRAKVPCHFLRSRGPHDLRSWVGARRTITELNPDILHFHSPAYWLHAALAGKRCKKIYHMHGPFIPATMSLAERFLMTQTRRIVDAEVCISRSMRNTAIDLGWGFPDRTWTVYNAVDCEAYEDIPTKFEAREALGLPQDSLILGMVCRLAW